MRKNLPAQLEAGRLQEGPLKTDPSWGATGYFLVQGPCGALLKIVSSDAKAAQEVGIEPWEHVSVSTRKRVPNWQEMCFVKNLFWEPEEIVVQFHPPRSEYVNNHPNVLHLWRPFDNHIRMPPSIMVGYKDLTTEEARQLAILQNR